MPSFKVDWKRMAEDFGVPGTEIRSVLGLKPFETFSEAWGAFVEVASDEDSIRSGKSSNRRASIFKEVLELANLGDLADIITKPQLAAWERAEVESCHLEVSQAAIEHACDFNAGFVLLSVISSHVTAGLVGKLVQLAGSSDEIIRLANLPCTTYPFQERRALYEKALPFYRLPEE